MQDKAKRCVPGRNRASKASGSNAKESEVSRSTLVGNATESFRTSIRSTGTAGMDGIPMSWSAMQCAVRYCTVCSKIFKAQNSLDNRNMTIHGGEENRRRDDIQQPTRHTTCTVCT